MLKACLNHVSIMLKSCLNHVYIYIDFNGIATPKHAQMSWIWDEFTFIFLYSFDSFLASGIVHGCLAPFAPFGFIPVYVGILFIRCYISFDRKRTLKIL